MRPLLFIVVFALNALGFELSRSVDRTSLTLGEPLVLTVTAVKKSGEKLMFPNPESAFGDFELLDKRSREEPAGERVRESHEYRLTVFKLGKVQIPSLKVMNSSDTADAHITEPVEVIVKKVTVADTSDIVDNYGQENLGYGPFFYLIILATLLVLGLGVYWLDRRFRKKKTELTAATKIVLPPEVQFEKELAALLAERLPEKGEIKAFYLKLSEILRRYLGARYHFYALESTTTELLAALQLVNIDGPILRQVEKFCDMNDPVKFAKWIPPVSECETLIVLTREIVNKTTPLFQAVPDERVKTKTVP
ncbi:MAG: hypothetical protein A2293_13540 [Elusimicrobia bacterium RIFOXYB2_FULL_49_7]|nr:MAG: hypothetical protein A2293_13540 [Elusimicrobia bacterium RIFOXYB2_FULL_49_7]